MKRLFKKLVIIYKIFNVHFVKYNKKLGASWNVSTENKYILFANFFLTAASLRCDKIWISEQIDHLSKSSVFVTFAISTNATDDSRTDSIINITARIAREFNICDAVYYRFVISEYPKENLHCPTIRINAKDYNIKTADLYSMHDKLIEALKEI